MIMNERACLVHAAFFVAYWMVPTHAFTLPGRMVNLRFPSRVVVAIREQALASDRSSLVFDAC